MSRTQPAGQPGAPGRRPPFADRRLLAVLASVIVLVIGFYVFQGWREGADRAARRGKLLGAVAAALRAEKPDLDRLGDLMAGLTMLEDADSAAEVLTPRAQIELLRGRPDRAYRLFGQIADAPGATAAQQRLGARIQLARQDSFGGDAATAKAMLEQVATFSQNAYADSGEAADLFRAWQASKRLWDHERAKGFAAQLSSGHADSKESRLVAVFDSFGNRTSEVAVEDLLIDFGDGVPAELAALRTALILRAGQPLDALAAAEKDLLRYAGVGYVRFILAAVLTACVQYSREGSIERGDYLQRRNDQLDWLEARAPAGEALRAQWTQMRAVR